MPIILDGENYLRATEVADLVGISRQTLWRWRQDNLVPPGRKFRDSQVIYTPEEVELIRGYANRIEPLNQGGK